MTARRRHLLDLDELTGAEIGDLLDRAEALLPLLAQPSKSLPLLTGKLVVNLFYEASTRTRISFEEAGKILGADVINHTPTPAGATDAGSLTNQGRTLSAMGADALVVRHPHGGAAGVLAAGLEEVSVVNAGDGAHAHPTQALLDLLAARRKLGDLNGRKLVIVGDLMHSRVARSAVWGFLKLGTDVVLCGPPALIPEDFDHNKAYGHPLGAFVETGTDLDRAIAGADLVMALRMQSERQQGSLAPGHREYVRRWQVTPERMALAGDEAMLMHPGPVNDNFEVHQDLVQGARSLIAEQVTAGVAVRMAVLLRLLGDDRPN